VNPVSNTVSGFCPKRALRSALVTERQPDPLGEHDERDPAQHRPRVAAVARAGALGADQAALLVEAQRRRRDAAAPRDLADREHGGHGGKDRQIFP
jgi:hypothetical protein